MSTDDAGLRETIHKALAKERFGKFAVHPAFMDPDSDMGQQAKRIAAAVLAAHPAPENTL